MQAHDQDFIDQILRELNGVELPINNRRCANDTSVKCTSIADCVGVGGTCQFFFGSNLPLSAGGVATCVMNQFNGTISGTANETTGSSAGAANLIARVYSGPTVSSPCPQCVGDPVPHDGLPQGTCSGGAHFGALCDIDGSSPNLAFGDTSFDCPPSPGALIATLPIDLANTTGTKSKTLSGASPNCRATGHTSEKCFCDTCNHAAATPCSSNADCIAVGASVCGGKRCLSGPNVGTPCAVSSECPGSACRVPGQATAPNQCDDATCSPDGGNEGMCAAGPFEQFCGPVETFRGCIVNADCPRPGDTCSVGKFRDCYTDNGALGASVNATGVADPPKNHCASPILATLFCISPTASAAVNAVTGLPGLGRLELPGRAVDDGTAGTCPTQIQFVGNSWGGVLDTGWTGQAHDATTISDGTVTVQVTSCSGVAPNCGVCDYVGPVGNPGAP